MPLYRYTSLLPSPGTPNSLLTLFSPTDERRSLRLRRKGYSQHPTPPQPPILPVPIRPPTPLLIPLMMQRNRVKLLKRIRNLAPRRLQPGIQRHTLHLRRGHLPALILPHEKIAVVVVAQVDGLRFFHVAEVDGVDAAALVGDYGWFGVPEQGPGGAAEEGVGFYV